MKADLSFKKQCRLCNGACVLAGYKDHTPMQFAAEYGLPLAYCILSLNVQGPRNQACDTVLMLWLSRGKDRYLFLELVDGVWGVFQHPWPGHHNGGSLHSKLKRYKILRCFLITMELHLLKCSCPVEFGTKVLTDLKL